MFKVLFVGGTGIISSACSSLAVERGFDLYLLNRGQTERPVPQGAHVLRGDIRDPLSARAALGKQSFDVVVDWVAYTPEHVQADIDLFRERTSQYIFISSAAAYHVNPPALPITESTMLYNSYWDYAQAKIACEDLLHAVYQETQFPVTIVRPSHTYDRTMLPVQYRYTVIDRMLKGKPVVIPGDGTSLWTLTHNTDFAKGFVGLLGNSRAVGEAVHITSDEFLTWNQIYAILADTAGAELRPVHIPSDTINAHEPAWGERLLGDKAVSKIFDNAKIKRLSPGFAATVPFRVGAREILDWYDEDPARKVIDEKADDLLDRLIAAQKLADRPEMKV